MKPTLIGCADLHYRDSPPKCRDDDFWKAQIKIMKWLKRVQKKYNVPMVCAGDYFDYWKPSPRLLSACIRHMPFVYTIPGNHDLPNHNLKLLKKSGLWTMERAKKVEILSVKLGEPYSFSLDGYLIGVIHRLINHSESSSTARSVLKEYKDKQFDLMLSGDNHKSFSFRNKRSLLINPGSISRQTADQVDHVPHVVLWDAVKGTTKTLDVPIDGEIISRKHLKRVKDRNERMEAFVSKLDTGDSVELDYDLNMKHYFEKNRTRQSAREMVWESMEQSGGV